MKQSPRRSDRSSREDKPAKSALGKSALRLLTALASGAVCASPPVDAEILIAADLASRRDDGTLAITLAGRAHLARHELARSGEADPFRAQHLGIVQTVGPDDVRVSLD